MSIQEHLNKIRNAIYGREVRESIAKGIETAYDDASEKDNANMEVKIARGTHPNLRSRLEEVDDKQQQTTAQLAQIGTARPSGAFPTLDDLIQAHPSGDGGNWYVVKENNNWYYWDGSRWESGGVFTASTTADFPVTNLIRNGNFVDTQSWVGQGTFDVDNNEARFLANVQFGVLRQTVDFEKGHVYYYKAMVKATSSNVRFSLNPKPAIIAGFVQHSGSGQYEKLSAITQVNDDVEFPSIRVIDNRASGRDEIFVKEVLAIDLTKVFGRGNEPEIDVVEGLLSKYPNSWFSGTVSPFVDNKELYNAIGTTNEVVDRRVSLINNQPFDVLNYNSSEIDVELGWATQVYIMGSTDGTTFSKMTVQSTETGSEFNRIDLPGKYQVNLNGVQKIKYEIISLGSESPSESVSVLLTSDVYTPLQKNVPSVQYAPSALPSVTTKLDSKIFMHLSKNGTSYYTENKRIYQSTDYGETITEIVEGYNKWGSATVKVHYLTELNDGRLLVWIHDWIDGDAMTLYRSDTNKQNFVNVLSYPYEGNIGSGWKPSVYNGLIVYGEYYPGRTDETLRIKLSQDYGATWKIIKEVPSTITGRVRHIHDVVFDPYRNRIWVAHGDYNEHANVEYSDDFGNTWKLLWNDGEAPVQFTTIHPMPAKVLLGSDSPLLRGMYEFKEGANVGSYTVEPLYIWTDSPDRGTAVHRGDQYWDSDNVVYFGSTEQINTSDVGHHVLWGSKDGYNLYQLYAMPGVEGGRLDFLSGPDSNGKMMARRGTPNGNMNYIIDAPTWETI